MLPFAATAKPEMLAGWLRTLAGKLMKMNGLTLNKAAVLTRNSYVGHIAGHGIIHKHHKIINPRQRFTLGSSGCDFHFFVNRKFFAFHKAAKVQQNCPAAFIHEFQPYITLIPATPVCEIILHLSKKHEQALLIIAN